MGPKTKSPTDDRSTRGEPENSGEAFQNDLYDLYGQPDEESEEQEG